MRSLLALVIVGALAWSGYWVIGARAQDSAVETWLEERRAEGWQVEYSDLAVRGFPNRFDLTISDLLLTDPDTGLSWEAPFFQLFALSYKPNHLIAIWPNTQRFSTPEQKLDITSEKMTASLVLKPTQTLELDRFNLIFEGASFASSQGWTTAFTTLNAAIRGTENKTNTYDLAISADDLQPGERWQKIVDRAGTLPDVLDAVRLDSEIALSLPIDIRTLEDARPDITALTIKEARAGWGKLAIRAAGSVTVNPEGVPDGKLDVNARNWRDMLALAVEADAISADAAKGAEFGLGLLANISGNSDSLDAPLSFRGGRSFLGPIPIGAAPNLSLR